jgi:hypothetical protein
MSVRDFPPFGLDYFGPNFHWTFTGEPLQSGGRPGWVCPKCGCGVAPDAQRCPCTFPADAVSPEAGKVRSHYDKCSCNPKNGGSGVCGCVLNTPVLT